MFNALRFAGKEKKGGGHACLLCRPSGLCVLLVVAGPAISQNFSRYTYLEQTGADKFEHTWTIQQNGNNVETRWISPDKAYYNRCDGAGNTLEWRVKYADGLITAKRAGNLIEFEGLRNGKPFSKQAAIDEAPWFQPLSYALGRFSETG